MDEVRRIEVHAGVSSLFDGWLPEERVDERRYLDLEGSETAYLALVEDALREAYPSAEILVYRNGSVPGYLSPVAVNDLVESDLCAEVGDLLGKVFASQEWIVWKNFAVYEARGDEMPPDLLREAAEIAARGEGPVEYATVTLEGQPEQLRVLYAATIGRAGIAHGAEADWTDASSLEDGVRRYLSGEMEN